MMKPLTAVHLILYYCISLKKKTNKMNKAKTMMMFVFVALLAGTSFAQSVDEGKQFLYYERYKSAQKVFEQMLASNPSNDQAAYYLGQALIGQENKAAAKKLYLDKMAQMSNSPLLLAGVGHIELLEGKTADARQHFETAISLSKGNNIEVLNAVGFANADYESKKGDAAYAVDVLTRATAVKKFNDPAVLVNLGDAYRKLGNGGQAITFYDRALGIDPKFARAIYRKGKIYQTQGRGQESLYLGFYNDAIAADAKYTPVYGSLFNYYYETDVNKAAQYLEQFLQNSDDDPMACHYRASIKYAQGLFQEAITKADQCITEQGSMPYAKLYQLKAFAYKRLNDTLNANKNFQEYFAKQDPDKLEGGDYAAYGALLVNYPGNEMKVDEYTNRAVMMDTLAANKASYMSTIAKAYADQNNNMMAAKWYSRLLDVKKGFTNVDIFNAGYNYYAANKMDSSNKYFQMYVDKYPNDIMGYYMLGNANAVIDSTGALGTAIPYYNKTIEIGMQDSTKASNVTKIMNAYKFFIGYYANVKQDNATALEYVNKGLALVPTDPQLLSFKEILSKAPSGGRKP